MYMVLYNYDVKINISLIASNESEVYDKLEKVYRALLNADVEYDTEDPKIVGEYL